MSLNSTKLKSFLEFTEENEQVWNTLIKRLKNSKHIVLVTGAGISVNSGIPYFRLTNRQIEFDLTVTPTINKPVSGLPGNVESSTPLDLATASEASASTNENSEVSETSEIDGSISDCDPEANEVEAVLDKKIIYKKIRKNGKICDSKVIDNIKYLVI
ncbi:hypothetical protein BC833DRAFT_626105 [Globomyces pollinis-pini]|nr:hypothetical protein BC833DRAFT_626105 [Globomyces pollinis-pini]